MPEVLTLALVASLIVSQLAGCMIGSRCTQISTPCLTLTRDVLPPDKMPNIAPAGVPTPILDAN
jgi:hypothetical protein